MRRNLLLVLLLLLPLLPSCAYLHDITTPSLTQWDATVRGQAVTYHVIDAVNRADAMVLMGRCNVYVDRPLYEDFIAGAGKGIIPVAAHELGHCLDGLELRWSSNGFRDEGCALGPYFCTPREGFAQTYMFTFIDACGWDAPSLGLTPGVPGSCELPDPQDATPAMAYFYGSGGSR